MALQGDEEDDATFEQVSAMADRLGLQGEDKQDYIHKHMTGLGYEPVQTRDSYRRPEPEGGEEESGGGRWWGSVGKRSAPAGNPPRSGGQTGADPDRF